MVRADMVHRIAGEAWILAPSWGASAFTPHGIPGSSGPVRSTSQTRSLLILLAQHDNRGWPKLELPLLWFLSLPSTTGPVHSTCTSSKIFICFILVAGYAQGVLPQLPSYPVLSGTTCCANLPVYHTTYDTSQTVTALRARKYQKLSRLPTK